MSRGQTGGLAEPAANDLFIDQVVLHVDTETGSRYELDLSRMIWRRVRRTPFSGELRAEGGELLLIGPIQPGRSLVVLYAPYDGDMARQLVTSPVVRVCIPSAIVIPRDVTN